jgi:hypothetical protein
MSQYYIPVLATPLSLWEGHWKESLQEPKDDFWWKKEGKNLTVTQRSAHSPKSSCRSLVSSKLWTLRQKVLESDRTAVDQGGDDIYVKTLLNKKSFHKYLSFLEDCIFSAAHSADSEVTKAGTFICIARLFMRTIHHSYILRLAELRASPWRLSASFCVLWTSKEPTNPTGPCNAAPHQSSSNRPGVLEIMKAKKDRAD